MNKVLVDTNVWVDIALNRDGFAECSRGAVMACIEDDVAMLIPGTSLKDVFYWKERAYGAAAAYEAIGHVLELAEVAIVDDSVCRRALELERPDYEDGIVAACALLERCDAIISRDAASFDDLPVRKYSPREFLDELGYEPVDW